jgi:hypothetical protein
LPKIIHRASAYDSTKYKYVPVTPPALILLCQLSRDSLRHGHELTQQQLRHPRGGASRRSAGAPPAGTRHDDPADGEKACRVARLESDGRFTTRADRYQGQRFNSPNDAVFKANGDLDFTDPPYGRRGRNDDPKKELPFNGVYRLATDGTVTLLTREMTFPTSLAFAPDEETLYVANSDPNRALWRACDVRDDGTLGKGRVFCDATPRVSSQKGLPDGIKPTVCGNRQFSDARSAQDDALSSALPGQK